MSLDLLMKKLKGSSSSGNYGHSGRPGKRGGSTTGGGFGAIGATRGMDKNQILAARDRKKLSSSSENERKKNAIDMAAKKSSAPEVLVAGNDVKTLTKTLGLPKDFYSWEVTGDSTAFGIRTESGRWTPSEKYLSKSYNSAKTSLLNARKREDRRMENHYSKQVRDEWRKVVDEARQQVIEN